MTLIALNYIKMCIPSHWFFFIFPVAQDAPPLVPNNELVHDDINDSNLLSSIPEPDDAPTSRQCAVAQVRPILWNSDWAHLSNSTLSAGGCIVRFWYCFWQSQSLHDMVVHVCNISKSKGRFFVSLSLPLQDTFTEISKQWSVQKRQMFKSEYHFPRKPSCEAFFSELLARLAVAMARRNQCWSDTPLQVTARHPIIWIIAHKRNNFAICMHLHCLPHADSCQFVIAAPGLSVPLSLFPWVRLIGS